MNRVLLENYNLRRYCDVFELWKASIAVYSHGFSEMDRKIVVDLCKSHSFHRSFSFDLMCNEEELPL